jgi:hypothetical protein
MIKVKAHTSNGSHLTFGAIGNKHGDVPKLVQSGSKEVDVILNWGHENSDIIGI